MMWWDSSENIEIFIKVLGLILTFAVTIYGYKRYNYIVKEKNRKLQLISLELEAIKKSISYINKVLIFTIVSQYLISGSDKKIVRMSLAIISIIAIVLITFILIMSYLFLKRINEKRFFDKHKQNVKRIKKNIYIFFCPIIITTINMLLLFTFIFMTFLFFKEWSRDIKSIQHYIESYVIIYIYWINFNMIIYTNIKTDLQIDIKQVKIFYNQNGETKVAFNIDYNELIIEKDFIVFYSKKEKCKNLIQSKDLLKIQYYYNDLS